MLDVLMNALRLEIAVVHALKLALIALLSVSLLLANTEKAHACVCETISPTEAFDSADLVFAGQVIDAQTFYYPVPEKSRDAVGRDYFEDTVYTFLVSAVWKGNPSEVTFVVSAQNPTSCTGREFSIGEEYVVYLESGISVGACSRIVRLDSAREDLRTLGAGQPPKSGTVATRPRSMDEGCSWEARVLAIVGVRHDRDFRGCFEAFASASTTVVTPTPTPVLPTPTPHPTPTAAPTPTILAAAVTSAPTPAPTSPPASVSEETDTPEWLPPAVTGIAGVSIGIFATILTLRRRGGNA